MTVGGAPALTRMRHELIRAELARSGGVRIRDLVARLGVSRATVRRDLHALVDAGEAVNARGGALLPSDRAHGVAALEREAIAGAAAEAVIADQIKDLGLFGGPLVVQLARRLTGQPQLRVVTNSLAVARVLAEPPAAGPQVTLLAGALQPSGVVLGSPATDSLAALRLDATYFDCAGFDPRIGAMVDDLCEAQLRRVSVQVSDRSVLLVERAGYGRRALSSFAGPADLHAVIDHAVCRPRGHRRTAAADASAVPRAGLSRGSSR